VIVTLEAGARAAVLRGHPWVYREAIRAVRGTPRTGDIVALAGPEGDDLGSGLFDASSPIAVRRYGRPGERLDVARMASLVERAVAKRDGKLDPESTTAYRLCHGEGDRVPGLVLDRYADVAIARTDGDAMAAFFPKLIPSLGKTLESRGVRSVALRIEAKPGQKKIEPVFGDPCPDTIRVRENGMWLFVDLAQGQKTGAFLDQRDNRARVRGLARPGSRVLNLFSYAGGFSLAAALGGASEVTSVDIATRAHATAQRSFRENGIDVAKHRFVTADAFVFLEEAKRRGDRYDLVISDPPSFAPSEKAKKKALAAYSKLHRACAAVLAPNGVFCASSCSSHVSLEELLGTLDDVAMGTDVLSVHEAFGPPWDHPSLACFPEGRYLKLVVMR